MRTLGLGKVEARERKRLVYFLAGEAGVDWRTVERWLDGETLHSAIAAELERATETLGVSAKVELYRGKAA